MARIIDQGGSFSLTPPVTIKADGTAIEIADAALLFNADFSRSGSDLVLVGADGKTIIIIDYFAADQTVDLLSPDGAVLSADVVAALAGPLAPAQYAQTGTPAGSIAIGQVETLTGTATATRENGTIVELKVGTHVFQGDVIQTGDGSSLGITFLDQTVFSLSDNARMVLNEMVYDPGGSSNSMLMNLVQGSFVFVAGQIAPTGDMKIQTPVATMGIRGTSPTVFIADNGTVAFSIIPDPGPEGKIGKYVLFNNQGQVIGSVNDTGSKLLLTSAGGQVHELAKTAGDFTQDQQVQAQVYSVFNSLQGRIDSGQSPVELNSTGSEPNTNPDNPDNQPDQSQNTPADGAPEVTGSIDSTPASGGAGESSVQSTTAPETTATDALNTGNDSSGQGPALAPLGDASDPVINSTPITQPLNDPTDNPVNPVSQITGTPGNDLLTGTAGNDLVQGLDGVDFLNGGAGNDVLDGGLGADTLTGGAGADTFVLGADVPDVIIDFNTTEDTLDLSNLLGPNFDIANLSDFVQLQETGSSTVRIDSDGAANGANFIDVAVLEDIFAGEELNFIFDARGSTGSVISADRNVAPVAQDDVFATNEDAGINSNVLADNGNGPDVDPENEQLVVVEVNGSAANVGTPVILASGAVLTLNADGTFAYDPNGQFEGLNSNQSATDTFDYTLNDGKDGFDTATVTVNIAGVNDAPVTGNVQLTVSENSEPVTEDFLVSDVDAGGSVASFDIVIQPAGGTLVNNNDGTFTFSPGTALQSLAQGVAQELVFTFTATDNEGAVSTPGNATITITGQNDAPIAIDDRIRTNEDRILNGDVFEDNTDGEDEDIDINDAFSVVQVNGSAADVGTEIVLTSGALLTLNADGTFDYDPNGLFDTLAFGQSATDSYTYTIQDTQGASDTATVTIIINGVNDAPVITSAATVQVAENTSSVQQVTATDIDVNVGSQLFFSLTGNGPDDAFFVIDGNGILSFQVPPDFENPLDTGNDNIYNVEVAVSDGIDTTTRVVAVTVSDVNDNAPVITSANIVDVAENSSNVQQVTASDTDTVGVQIFSLTGKGADDALFVIDGLGNLRFQASPDFENPLDTGNDNVYNVDVSVSDGVNTTTQAVAVSVTDINEAPVARNDAVATSENTVLNGDVFADNGSGIDFDVDIGDIFTVSQVNGNAANVGNQLSLESGALLTLNADGTFAYDPNGQFESLGNGQTTTDSFDYTIEDGNGGFSSATATVTVTGVNDAPVVVFVPNEQFATVNSAFFTGFDPLDVFFDIDDFDVLTLDAQLDNGDLLPNWLTFDGADFFGTPTAIDGGTITVELTGFDDPGESEFITFDITVSGDILGTAGNDNLQGNAFANLIQALGGNDRIAASPGGDVIDGGLGTDTISFINNSQSLSVNLLTQSSSSVETGNDTLISIENVIGGAGDDTITGNVSNNTLLGRGGDDTLDGGAGDDVIDGGSGINFLTGGAGNDTLIGGTQGDDNSNNRADYSLATGGITAILQGSIRSLQSTVTGDASVGSDILDSIEVVIGSQFDDTFTIQRDFIGQFGGFNEVLGEGGDDIIFGNGATRVDFRDANAGVTVDFEAALGDPQGLTGRAQLSIGSGGPGDNVGVDSFTGVNSVSGSEFDDTVFGSNGNQFENFRLRGGNDVIDGGGGNDILIGGFGDNRLIGGAGNDTLIGASTIDEENIDFNRVDYRSATAGITVDLRGGLNSFSSTATGDASVGTDILVNAEFIFGTNFADTFTIETSFTNRFGSFIEIEGSGGDDVIFSNNVTGPRVGYKNATDSVTVNLELGTAFSTNAGDTANIGTDTFFGIISRVRGSDFDDVLIGSDGAGAENFCGQAGNDFIDGGGGIGDRADYRNSPNGVFVDLSAGAIGSGFAQDGFLDQFGNVGIDTLVNIERIRGSEFADEIIGDDGANFLQGRDGADLIDGGAGNDDLRGGDGQDLIRGGAGNDTIIGGADADTLFGGDGNDQINGGDGNDRIAGDVGIDTLTGGGGQDTFEFTDFSTDTVTDFVVGQDRLDLAALIGGNFTVPTLGNFVRAVENAGNTTIQVDSDGALNGQNFLDVAILNNVGTGSAIDFFFDQQSDFASVLSAAPLPVTQTVIELSTLNGTNGFVLNGVAGSDFSGGSVSSAGDINGDGFDDVIIGANFADNNGNFNAGGSYVVFGQAGGFSASLELSALNGTNGFVINGVAGGDNSGLSVSSAGDINGDGIADVIIGAEQADPNGTASGASYVVFGQAGGFSASLNLSSLNGTNGFVINGINAGDSSGSSVSSAGDVNGDGIDDVIIGAVGADPNGTFSGASYVVFGQAGGFSASLNLSSLNGTNGFVINGVAASNQSGRSVSAAGDVNGDGIGDVIISAPLADPNGLDSGASYVVFGKSSGFGASLELSSLDGTNGFVINGVFSNDLSGRSVSSAGDVNGDGFDDVIIGAELADPNGNISGESYVVFGRASGFGASFELSALDGTNGFVINGIDVGDKSGISVSSAGDVNGDGFGDVIIGAETADGVNGSDSGESYVVFGKAGGFSATLELSTLDGTNGFIINGIDGNDLLLGGAGNDELLGGSDNDILDGEAGSDSLTGGPGSDIFRFADASAVDTVTDFTIGQDQLDLSGLLDANFAPGVQTDFIEAIDNGLGDTVLNVDADGAGALAGFEAVALLEGITAGDSIDFIFDTGLAGTSNIVVA